MTYKVKSIEFSDIVVLDNGDKYKACDSEGRAALFSLRAGDSVDISGSFGDKVMKVPGREGFKVKRV